MGYTDKKFSNEYIISHWYFVSNIEIVSEKENKCIVCFGDSITDNGNGTYTLNNTVSLTYTDWFNNYSNYTGKYTCNSSSTTCENPRFILWGNSRAYDYVDISEKIDTIPNKYDIVYVSNIRDWIRRRNNIGVNIINNVTDIVPVCVSIATSERLPEQPILFLFRL